MSAAWVVAVSLYGLGFILEWVTVGELTDGGLVERLTIAALWPVLVVLHLAHALWSATLGGWLWRREHALWVRVSSEERPE